MEKALRSATAKVGYLSLKTLYEFSLKLLLLSLMVLLVNRNGYSQTSITIGPSGTSTASVTYGPMNCGTTAARYNRTAYIYPSTLFPGLTNGDQIVALAFRKAVTTAPTGSPNFKMYIKNTGLANFGSGSLTWATEIATATLVFDGNPNSILGSTSGFKTFSFTSPFNYTGGNIAVYVEYIQTSASTAVTWIYDTQTGVPDYATNQVKYASSTAGSTPAATLGTSSVNHPQLRIDFNYSLNATIDQIVPHKGICAGGSDSVRIRIKNLGVNTITSVDVNWTINGVAQAPFVYNGSLATNASATVAIGSINFPVGQPIDIKAWTNLPNGVADKFPANDTILYHADGPALSAGTYTIGGLTANYPNLLAAVKDLNERGVCGPVVFNVDPLEGPYIGQIELKEILGASATNTIVFNGNGATIIDTINSSKVNNKHIVFLNGTDYTTFDNFTITYEETSLYCLPVVIGNGANYNRIKNCQILMDPNTTTVDFSAISFTGSSANYIVATNASYNIIENNLIRGGYAGVALVGTNGSQHLSKGNIIRNNTIQDHYLYGVYAAATDSTQIVSNDISKPNRLTYAGNYGMYFTTHNQSMLVEKNRVHDVFFQVPTSTSNFYAFFVTGNDARAGKEMILRNNLAYNLRGNGTQYGFHTNNSDSIWYFNNTVHIDNPNATAGGAVGIYTTAAATGVKYLNNNIVISKAGNGNKHGVFVNTADVTATINYNNIYVDTTVGKAGQRNIGYFVSTPFVTLANWKTANSNMWDQNSVSARALFANVLAGDFTPNSFDLNNIGTPIPQVTEDINGVARNATNPDPGAYEFTPILNDAGIIAMTLVNGSCAGNNPIGFRLKNFGANDLTSAQINWTVDGIPRTPFNYTGNLGSGQDTMVYVGLQSIGLDTAYTIHAWSSLPNTVADNRNSNDTIKNINYKSAMNGTYTVGGVGARYQTISEAATDLNNRGVCGPVIIDVNKNAGPYNEQVRFDQIVGTSAVNTVRVLGHGSALNFSSISSVVRYGFYLNGSDYVTIDSFVITPAYGATNYGWGIFLGTNSDYNKITNNIINLNNDIITQNYTGITLTGSTSVLNSTGGLFVGNLIENNTIYGGYYNINIYGVAGSNALTRANRIIGNKMYDPYHYSVSLFNQDSAEVSKNEMSRSTRVTSVNFVGVYCNGVSGSTKIDGNNIHDAFNANPSTTQSPYGIYFTNCPHSAGREAIVTNNVVYNFAGSGGHYGLYAGGTSSYIRFYNNTISLDNKTSTTGSAYGFYQTGGTSNIEVKNNTFSITRGGSSVKYGIYLATNPPGVTADYNNYYINATSGNVGYYSSAKATLADWKAANSNAYDQNGFSVDPEYRSLQKNNFVPNSSVLNNAATPIAAVTKDYNGTTRSVTPDIGAFEFTPTVNDAEVMSIEGPNIVCNGSNPVPVKIKNKGTATLSSLVVNWSVNNVVQTPFNFTGAMPKNKDSIITIGSFVGVSNTVYNIKVWSTLPNGLADENTLNDSTQKLNILTGLAGTYTIGNTPANYTSFNAAVSDLLSRGVCGPVVFSVNASDGPYEEKVTITTVPGASSTNTVTFKGNEALLTTVITASADRGVLTLNNADYIIIDSLTIEVDPTSTYGYPVVITNTSDNNIIRNSVLKSINVGSSNYAGLVIGAPGSISTASNSRFNLIENNTIIGGYYGITVYGTSGSNALTAGNILKDNKIQDFYYYGLYHYYADGTQIIGNDISRPNATQMSSTTYATYILGASQNLLIEKNKIHNMFDQDPSGTGALYALHLSTGAAQVGKKTIVRNNLVYNINSSGTHYGMYNSTSGNVQYYHNTIILDHQATAGTAYGFYQTGSADSIELKNNNFVISKTGSGTKYGIYMVTAATPLLTNYNNLYVPTGNVGYNSSARATLADWQAVNATFDPNSISVNPIFPYRSIGNFMPASPAINDLGTPLANVTSDILGNARSLTTPDMGAYEFTPVNDDAAITSFEVGSVCAGNNPIAVKLRSLGANALTSVNIHWTLNGVPQTMIAYSGSLATGADTSLILGNINFVVGNSYSLKVWSSLPNGVTDPNPLNDTLYANNIRTGLRGVYTIGGVGANYPTLSAAANDLNNYGVCGNVTFNVNPTAGPYNEQVTLNAVAGTSDTSKIVFNGNGALVTYNATTTSSRQLFKLRGTDYVTIDSFILEMNPSSTYGFPIHVLSGSNHNTIKRNIIKTIPNSSSTNYGGIVFSGSESSPSTAGLDMSFNTIENNTIYNGYYTMVIYGTSTNSASCKGNVIRNNKIYDSYIYSLFTVGVDSLIVSGNDISRPTRSTSSTFYGIYNSTNSFKLLVEKNKIHNPFDGNLTSTSASYGIYTASSDAAPGSSIIKNNVIYNFNGQGAHYGLANNGSDSIYYYHNTVVMNDTAQSSAVVNGFLQTSTAAIGVKLKNNNFVITRPGSANRIGMYWTTSTSSFESDYNNFYIINGVGVNAVSYFVSNYNTLADWKASNSNIYDQNSIDINPLFNLASSGIFRPFSGGFDNKGIYLTEVTTDIMDSVRGVTPDIGAYEFTAVGEDASVSSLGFASVCAGVNPVSVNILNSSANILSSVDVNWSVNGVAQPVYNFSGSLASTASTTVTLGNYNFLQGQAYTLKFWTSSPNGFVDANPTNDTLLINNFTTALSGTYTIGGVGANFPSLVAAVNTLNAGGVCGPVEFIMNPAAGPYDGQVSFGNIDGASSTNTIIVRGRGSVITGTLANTEERHLIRLNGTKYLTLDSIYANVSVASSVGYALVIGNNANYNTITNGQYHSIAATSNSFGGIMFVGTPNSPTSASNSSYNRIENNLITGGYYGISVYGASGGNALNKGNILKNNVIKDFYSYGIYNMYADSTYIMGNDISRPGQTATTTTYGIYCGGASQDIIVEKNKIHHLFELLNTNTSAMYGIGFATSAAQVGKQSIVKNNLLYALNNSGTHYGLYNSTSGNVAFYNNTLVDDFAGATAGTTYGIYQTGSTTGIEYKNNNVWVSRAGSGVKYGIYMATAASPITSNYNNFYVPNGNVGYNTTAQQTLANWQAAVPGIDANSVSVNPLFNFANVGNYIPASAALDNKGQVLTSVVDDITGALRDLNTPDIGAYEFTPQNNDISISKIIYPVTGNKCGLPSDSVVFVVENTGALDQTGFNIRLDVTGANNTTINHTYVGSLVSGGADTITISPYNTNFSGAIYLTLYTQLGNDAFRKNDTARVGFVASTASALPIANNVTVCKGEQATLVASGSNNIFRWYDAPVGGNLLALNDTFITPNVNSTTSYYVSGTTGTNNSYTVGPLNVSIGTNGNFVNPTVQYLEFDALSTFTLDSVSIYPNGPGNVEVRLLSNTGAVLQTRVVAVSTTQVMTRIPVGFVIPPGTAYRMDGGPATTTGGLWRNSAGGVYPYTVPGIVSITGNSFSTTAYYYYYNWRVTGGAESCPSPRKEVVVNTAIALKGTSYAQGSVYEGVFNAGTIGNPDRACAADTLEYLVNTPTGFNAVDFGTTWNIADAIVKTTNNNPVLGQLTVSGRSIRYIPASTDVDSQLVISVKVKDLSGANCDTLITRNLSIGSSLSVNIGNDTTICFGQAITLNSGVAGQTYLWNTGATTQSITVSTAGTYSVTVTNISGCSSSDQIVLNLTTEIPVNLGPDKSICAGSSTQLDAGTHTGATYLWSTGATTQTINVNAAGTYHVKVTVGDCFERDTIVIGINQNPTVELGPNKTICASDSVTLDAGNIGSTYLWSTGATTRTIVVKTQGNYSVTVTNTNGCSSTDNITVNVQALPNATYTGAATNGLNWQFNGPTVAGATYAWNFGDPTSPANTSSIQNPIHLFTAPGTYTVTLTVTNVATGCINTTSQTFVVTSVGVQMESGIKVYYASPNPFDQQTTIHYELENDAVVKLEVYDMLGRLVSTPVNNENQSIGKHEYTINENLNAVGVYQVRLTVNGATTVLRILKGN